jgi:hypothetical protein
VLALSKKTEREPQGIKWICACPPRNRRRQSLVLHSRRVWAAGASVPRVNRHARFALENRHSLCTSYFHYVPIACSSEKQKDRLAAVSPNSKLTFRSRGRCRFLLPTPTEQTQCAKATGEHWPCSRQWRFGASRYSLQIDIRKTVKA